jgi:hypothetical protein
LPVKNILYNRFYSNFERIFYLKELI